MVHARALWAEIDGWLSGLPDGRFVEVLPLLRRTFADYPEGVREQLRRQLARPGGASISLADLMRANFNQMHDGLIASCRVGEEQFQADLRRLDDPATTWPSSILWNIWGRKA